MAFDVYVAVTPLVRMYSVLKDSLNRGLNNKPEFLKEIQSEKIRIRLLGGIVYKHFGGTENIGDVDYKLLVSEAGEAAAKIYWPAGIMPQDLFFDCEKSQFVIDYVESPYHYDDNGICHIPQDILVRDFTRSEICDAEIYIPTKCAFIREQQGIIDKYKPLEEFGWRERVRVQKAKRRIDELMAL